LIIQIYAFSIVHLGDVPLEIYNVLELVSLFLVCVVVFHCPPVPGGQIVENQFSICALASIAKLQVLASCLGSNNRNGDW
jgi:hypothetical protein